MKPIERGMRDAERCEAKAVSLGWDKSGARWHIVGTLREKGQMTGEALVNSCKARGYVPHDDRAFGSLFAWLSRFKVIYKVFTGGVREKGKGANGLVTWALTGNPFPPPSSGRKAKNPRNPKSPTSGRRASRTAA